MSSSLIIALDAMGGDHAPSSVLDGARLVSERHRDIRFLIFGDEARLEALMGGMGTLSSVAEIRHAPGQVGPDDKAGQALRRGHDTSMRLAIDAVAEGEARGVVSGGNTGALMAISKVVLRTLPGIERPAIAAVFPTLRGGSVVLDLGANIDCDANNLVQFAVMGAAFARTVLGQPRPTVGLLNVGEEELKGNDTVRLAAQMLRSAELPLEFHGFIEGDDITKGTTDVVVTDGFTGNIALKTAEGSAKLYTHYLRLAFGQSLLTRLSYLMAKPALRAMRDRLDPRTHNGGVFLGLNGISVKSHGGADETGFAAAIGVAADMARDRVNDHIIEDYRRFGGSHEPSAKAAAS